MSLENWHCGHIYTIKLCLVLSKTYSAIICTKIITASSFSNICHYCSYLTVGYFCQPILVRHNNDYKLYVLIFCTPKANTRHPGRLEHYTFTQTTRFNIIVEPKVHKVNRIACYKHVQFGEKLIN